jgi:integrase
MLTDTAVKKAKPGQKAVKLTDSRGLYLLIATTGGKLWRFNYRYGGKYKTLALGGYPDVSLAKARERCDTARKLLADGIDPGAKRKAEKAARTEIAGNSFEVIAREWHTTMAKKWNPTHAGRILRRLELNVFPWIGSRPVADITAPEVLRVLRRIETRGLGETSHRAKWTCGQVFRYAIATGRADRDPTPDLRGALLPLAGEHFPAVTDPKQVGALLRTLDSYQGTLTVACALRLAPLVFVRPGELRQALWADIDLDAAEWRYIVPKTGTPHIVPLSVQAVAILREVYALTGRGRYVFPSARGGTRPMSDNAILAAMRSLGIAKEEMTGHGFRAMARTLLDEVLHYQPHIIEHQLAHAVRDPLGRAYNRTTHLPERRGMMQAWADYLDKLRTGADVVPFRVKTR